MNHSINKKLPTNVVKTDYEERSQRINDYKTHSTGCRRIPFSIEYILSIAGIHQHQVEKQFQLFHNYHNYYNYQQTQVEVDTKKKSRTVFTRSQVMRLESIFQVKKYISSDERSQIAYSLQLSEAQVKTWFQNRRNKYKRIDHGHLNLRTNLTK